MIWWIPLVLVALNVAVYASVARHEFVSFDDPQYVVENTRVTAGLTWAGAGWAFTTGAAGNWHPLTWLSHMADVQLFGVNPGAHHVINLLLHIANTLLLFGVLWQMTGSRWRSAFVAAVFAVHPLHVESVAWISERKDVLSTMFWMLTMWAYVRYARAPGMGRYALVATSLAMGLMAKPMLVTLPAVLLLLDVWPLARVSLDDAHRRRSLHRAEGRARTWRRLVVEKLPLFALVAISSVVTVLVQRRAGAVSALQALPLSTRIENAVVAYVSYIGNAIWPVRLAVLYPYSRSLSGTVVLGSALILGAITFGVLQGARRRPFLAVGWLWYLGTLLPVIGLIQVGVQSRADRYMYVPLIGLLIMVAWGLPDFAAERKHWRTALATAAVLAIGACAGVAHAQVQHWRNSLALWQHAVDVTTNNAHALAARGSVLDENGKSAQAIADYREALRIEPDFAEAHNKLGVALSSQGNATEAWTHYVEALRLKPRLSEAHNNIANAMLGRGSVEDAIAHFNDALRIDPEYADAHNGLGSALDDEGKIDAAIAEYAEAIRLNPNLAHAHNNMGTALSKQGRAADALQEFQEAVRLKPDNPDFRYNLAIVLDQAGRTAEALTHLEVAMKVAPGHRGAREAFDIFTHRTPKPGAGS